MKVNVPPLKSQGIKTKLVPWINSIIPNKLEGKWLEPFMGTGVVAFNLASKDALLCDINPHLIEFYESIAEGIITPQIVKQYLISEGAKLLENGESHYYKVRHRFNEEHQPLDFLFLNRSGFNGMIRFNKRGEFNIPFCRKPNRFSQSYITKIVNQVAQVSQLFQINKFVFKCQSFEQTILAAEADDLIYCDPPYIDRNVDYYNGWNEEQEQKLYQALSCTKSQFILSTWHHNDYRKNEYIKLFWQDFNILTREHFYHVGGQEKNRNPVIEALVTNYEPRIDEHQEKGTAKQLSLLKFSRK
jgi:DNA adenine methylase